MTAIILDRFVNPDFEPLPFQDEAVAFGIQYGRVLIPLPTGSGKTYIALRILFERYKNLDLTKLRFYVFCSGNALYTWQKNIKKHLPQLFERTAIMSKMDAEQRRRVYNSSDVTCIVVRFKAYCYDVKNGIAPLVNINLGIGDETHKFMRNHKSKQFVEVTKPLFAGRVKDIIHLTAHPISKGRQQIWPSLHVFNRFKYKSYWGFVEQFCIVQRGGFGMEILGPKNTDKYRRETADHIFRPINPIVGLPKINRSSLIVEMTPKQTKAYRQLENSMWLELQDGGLLVTANVLAMVTRLRQVLCCPAILDPALGVGGGFEGILEHIEEDEERKHAIIGVPFTAAMPYLQDALQAFGYKRIITFRAGMELDDLEEAETGFRNDPSSVALCSIKYSQSFELETGFPLYFNGYDFDPFENEQLEGRAKRLTTQRSFLPAYYLHHIGTYDDRMLEINGNKVSNTKVDANKASDLVRVLLGRELETN